MNNMRNPNPRNYTRRNENERNSHKGCCSNSKEMKFFKAIDQVENFSTQGNKKGEVSDSKCETLPNPSQST